MMKKIDLCFMQSFCPTVRMYDFLGVISIIKSSLFSAITKIIILFSLVKDESANPHGKKKKIIPVTNDILMESRCDESSLDGSHTSPDDPDLDLFLDSPDELEDSIMESK